MPGLGTIINIAGILLGGVLGLCFGKLLKERHQQTLTRVCGVSTLFIGIGGALEGMLSVNGDGVVSGSGMMIVICLSLGALIGELLNIEDGFERFGQWLKLKTGNARDKLFVDGFVTASLTVCIGAMAIVGAVEDGLHGNYTILAAKSMIDFVLILVMASSMGKGAMFSAIPVGIFQGSVTLLARLVEPVLTTAALNNLSLVGSALIFCVGLNLLWKNMIRVANLLPALLVAVVYALLGF